MQQYAVWFILLQSHSTCFGCHHTHHQGYYKLYTYFPPTWPDRDCSPDLATLEGSRCTDIMTCTGGCGYNF